MEIGWQCYDDSRFSIWWRESGGPTVIAPDHAGFGTTLIRDVPAHSLGGKVDLRYPEDGVRWSLDCDASVLAGPVPAAA